jgi:dipeptidyl aminopeptidase/acylaminoacyl peptidase
LGREIFRLRAFVCPWFILLTSGLIWLDGAEPNPTRRFTIDDLLAIKRISESQVSPDGKMIVYAIKTPNLEKNTSVGHLWIVPAEGGTPWQLTNHEKGESRPRWSPDSQSIAFLSSRAGSQQIWLIPIAGGEAKQITSISTEADNHIWSKTGKHFAFASEVWPELDEGDAAQKKRKEDIEASGIKAQVIDHLLYRHWNDWRHGKRTHVFMVSAEGGEPRDLTPGDFDAPPFSLGGPDGFDFSPDGAELAFTRGPARDVEAWSTDANLFVVSVAGGKPACLTQANKGWDGSPSWSPDGKYLAFRSQAREGYESDKFRLAVNDRTTGKTYYLADELDRSVDEIIWGPDSQSIYFVTEEAGRAALYKVSLNGLEKPAPAKKLLTGVEFTGLSLPKSGKFFVGEFQSLVRPVEIGRLEESDSLQEGATALKKITSVNDAFFSEREMPSYSSVQYAGALGAQVQSWLVKPPRYDPGRKYPFVLFIHGGPQGAWQDAFSFRWNAALVASRGFVVMAVNPHGSTGFGHPFTEQISGDWAGAAYEDLMKAVDWAIAQGIADPQRLAAAGGSFGGYMVNWILGHTNRFKALVSHAGVYNLESMYGATEELWFPEWDLNGTPWKNDGVYERFSPHRFAGNFRTATLVIHGELDFRVPITEGMQLFTALKRQGVDARFLYFPDEGHWILKPKNSKLWNETVIAWLERFLSSY